MKKYNIALLPLTKTNDFINISQKFSSLSGGYLLGLQSLPHVTIGQFHSNEDNIFEMWEKACDKLTKFVNLSFKEISFITFDKVTFWISLIPEQIYILNEIHSKLTATLSNPIERYYDPHLTLVNTTNKLSLNEIKRILEKDIPIFDGFFLALGECDELGQLTKIINGI